MMNNLKISVFLIHRKHNISITLTTLPSIMSMLNGIRNNAYYCIFNDITRKNLLNEIDKIILLHDFSGDVIGYNPEYISKGEYIKCLINTKTALHKLVDLGKPLTENEYCFEIFQR